MEPTNTITLEEAQDWAGRYRANPANTIKGYLIPEDDIVQLKDQPDVTDIRAYMGIDDTGEHKLMLVGVDKEGNDLIDPDNGHYIYDFTTPCPTTCDTKSPLFSWK